MADKTSIIQEAQKYLARGQIDKAIAEWEKLAKEYPDAGAFNAIGDLYLKKGDKRSAIESYHQAARFFKQEGFALKSLALYKKILNINGQDADALIALGELTEAKGLVTDAIKFYLSAADSFAKAGNREKLLSTYEQILVLSPDNIPLRIKLAELYVQGGLMPEALKQYFRIAHLHSESGDTGKAAELYEKILADDHTNRQAIVELNVVYEKSGAFEKAISQIREALELLPEDTEILLRAVELYSSLGKFDEAKEYLARVIEIEPANLRARKTRGDLYLREGDRKRAWEEYLPVLDEVLLEENVEEAMRLLESFRDVDPVETGKRLVTLYMQRGDNENLVSQLLTLGDIFFANEKLREALNYYREAYKITPEDEGLRNRVVELEKNLGKEHITIQTEKTLEEAFIEADIYLRYGLPDKALDVLAGFRQTEPENINLHQRLKQLYAQTGRTREVADECIILHDLYKKAGDAEGSGAAIREGLELFPDDPRLLELTRLSTGEQPDKGAGDWAPSLANVAEEIIEADVYAQQGLLKEAREVLVRLKSLFPTNREIEQKLAALEQAPEEVSSETRLSLQPQEPESQADELSADDIPVSPSESNVMDIFTEFKKGLEKEIEAEDYETHYNLGIAYKEMGLIDDAIKEFQASLNDPKRFTHASNMLGMCYIEKGLYSPAIDVLKRSLSRITERDESYWAIQYDLAEAYEKNGNIEEALRAYLQVYQWNAQFRNTSEKINALKSVVLENADKRTSQEKKDRVSYL